MKWPSLVLVLIMSSVDDVLATLKVFKKQLTSLRPTGDSVKDSEEAWVTLEQEAKICFCRIPAT